VGTGSELPPPERLRVLYADIDGTLTGPGGSLFGSPDAPSSATAGALVALYRAGVEVVLVSGRTRDQTREAARLLGARGFIAELGAFVVERGAAKEEVTTNFGAFAGDGTPLQAMVRSGAGAFLLERYAGRLELHTPWAHQNREATMMFRGLVDERETTGALARARYDWLELRDNGRISRTFETLDVPEVHAYHLVPRGVNKASAVRIHRERRGIRIEAAAAVGDSPSDLEMGTEVARMILVGAAAPPSEPATGDTAGSVRHLSSTRGDGFARAVEFLLGANSPR
jgi:hydroxymethylpyrimidine pyrophosphatase-like HAD family hydrolase